jgi:apolipoprotein N-acyltransferase
LIPAADRISRSRGDGGAARAVAYPPVPASPREREQAIRLRTSGAFTPPRRAAAYLADIAGMRRWGWSFLLGVLAAGALPPIDSVPLLVVAFSGLVWLLDGVRAPRAALATGWWFGFGFFLAGLYWVAIALTVDIARFWWLMPFAAAGLPAAFALFTAVATLAAWSAAPTGLARIVALAIAWSVAEWLRGHVLTGFPWNLAGYAWAGDFPGGLAVLQATSVVGIYGLSFLTVLAAALPATLADPGRRRWVPTVAALVAVAAIGVAGGARLMSGSSLDHADVRLRLVQPSIAQSLKWDPAAREANFRAHLALSAQPGNPNLVIWPEAAATFYLNRHEAARQAIAQVIPPGGLLVTGAPRTDPPPQQPTHVWNSLAAIDAAGMLVATYDKFHLVPFGEYVPLRGVLPIEKVTAGTVDFSAGPGPQTLTLPGFPAVGPLICYEVIFPAAVTEPGARPDWLLNLTNDAWYGRSSGPYQHFAIARTRAVEEGLPLVRAANNGISGVFDAYGRVRARLGLDAVGALDAALPQKLAPTVYARVGDLAYAALLGAALLSVVATRRR